MGQLGSRSAELFLNPGREDSTLPLRTRSVTPMKSTPARLVLSTSLITLILASGCATKERIVTVTESANGSTVNIGAGDRLRVELPSNPSTGYSWQTMELNSWVLARTKRPVYTPGYNATTRALVIEGSLANSSSAAWGGALSRCSTVRACPPAASRARDMLAMFTPWEPSTVPR